MGLEKRKRPPSRNLKGVGPWLLTEALSGAHSPNRTGDLLFTRQRLYQLSYVGRDSYFFLSLARSILLT